MTLEDKVRKEHDEIKAMVASLLDVEREEGEAKKTTLAGLVQLISDHEEAEERTFYRAMREDDRLREMALEGVEQHGIIETLLENLSGVSVEDELWLPKLKAMKSVLDSHLLVEERLFIPTAQDILGSEAVERLDREWGAIRPGQKVGVLRSTAL